MKKRFTSNLQRVFDNGNQVIIPDFQEDLPVEENQDERFIQP